MIKHFGTMEIEGENITLRRFKRSDAEVMFETWANDSEVTRYLSWKPHGDIVMTREIIETWLESYKRQDYYHWGIEYKDSGCIVGSIGVVESVDFHMQCQIGYCIGKAYWGKGLTTEALKTVIQYLAQKVGYNRVQALHHSENKASGKVMIKAGMQYEGRLRQYQKNNRDELVDCDLYAVLKQDLVML